MPMRLDDEQHYEQMRDRLAHNVRTRRRAMDISQEQLSFDCGLDRTYISQIERGVGNPSLKVLCELAVVLQMELADLFSESAPAPTLTKKKRPA